MVYRFTIISDEVDNFVRVIKIDSDATFYDFHKAILDACNYKDDQMTSFFICEDDWEKKEEVTLEEMDRASSSLNCQGSSLERILIKLSAAAKKEMHRNNP